MSTRIYCDQCGTETSKREALRFSLSGYSANRTSMGQLNDIDIDICRDHDPELWFSGKPYEQAAALAVCRSCPVVDECRAFADDNNRIGGYPLQGIWGGKQYGRTSRPRKERE